MTHIPTGDRGQRYEVTYRDPDTGERKTFGWSTDMEGAQRFAHAIELHPSMDTPQIRDRSMADGCLCPDFELRGRTYEIWTDSLNPSNRCLVDPIKREVVDTDHDFTPPLSNDELLAIYDYGKGY